MRAIRSYIGANSGPLTQREHVFYERREDVRTFLRVHAVPGPLDYFDYSAAAIGMTYKNTNNTAGVTIDGTPDSVTAGPLTWETVDGPQGGLSMAHTVDTDIAGLATTSYYLDDSTPAAASETQCTGDDQAYRRERTVEQPGHHPEHRPAVDPVEQAELLPHDLLRGSGQGQRAGPQRSGGQRVPVQRVAAPAAGRRAIASAGACPAIRSARFRTPARTPGRARATDTSERRSGHRLFMSSLSESAHESR